MKPKRRYKISHYTLSTQPCVSNKYCCNDPMQKEFLIHCSFQNLPHTLPIRNSIYTSTFRRIRRYQQQQQMEQQHLTLHHRRQKPPSSKSHFKLQSSCTRPHRQRFARTGPNHLQQAIKEMHNVRETQTRKISAYPYS
jgi:hypothetical protein